MLKQCLEKFIYDCSNYIRLQTYWLCMLAFPLVTVFCSQSGLGTGVYLGTDFLESKLCWKHKLPKPQLGV